MDLTVIPAWMWALMLGIVAVAIAFTLGWWLRGTDSERALEDASERYGKQAGQLFDALDQRNAAREQCELMTGQWDSLLSEKAELLAERDSLIHERDARKLLEKINNRRKRGKAGLFVKSVPRETSGRA